MRLITAVAIVSALLPFAAATYTPGSNSCKQNEFWWDDKSCCLPKGGPPAPPSPPKGSDCPPTSYYWGDKQGCCVPRNPPPSNAPEPQCRSNWSWRKGMRKCLPTPSTTTYSAPSQTPDNGRGYGPGRGGYHKREAKSRAANLCPTGLDACPIKGLTTGDYECVDTDSELESCGGCTSLGKGQDCTAIPGAWNVGCERGSCIVFSCAGGFVLGLDGKSCVEL